MRFAGSQLGNFLDPSNFDAISKSAMQGRSTERMSVDKARGLVDLADINAEGTIKAAEYGASAIRAEGSAQGSAAMFGGIADGIGGIASGFANRDKPKPKPAPGQPVPTPQQSLNGPSYLNPTAPSSIADYQLKLGGW